MMFGRPRNRRWRSTSRPFWNKRRATPDAQRAWRWNFTDPSGVRTVVSSSYSPTSKTAPSGAPIEFAGCDEQGAANLRGTGYAAKDTAIHQGFGRRIPGRRGLLKINVTGLAASCSPGPATHSRRTPKRLVRHRVLAGHNENGGVRRQRRGSGRYSGIRPAPFAPSCRIYRPTTRIRPLRGLRPS